MKEAEENTETDKIATISYKTVTINREAYFGGGSFAHIIGLPMILKMVQKQKRSGILTVSTEKIPHTILIRAVTELACQ